MKSIFLFSVSVTLSNVIHEQIKTGDQLLNIFLSNYLNNEIRISACSDHYSELWVANTTNEKVVYYKLVGCVWSSQDNIIKCADAHAIPFTLDGSKAYITNLGAHKVSVVEVLNKKYICRVQTQRHCYKPIVNKSTIFSINKI